MKEHDERNGTRAEEQQHLVDSGHSHCNPVPGWFADGSLVILRYGLGPDPHEAYYRFSLRPDGGLMVAQWTLGMYGAGHHRADIVEIAAERACRAREILDAHCGSPLPVEMENHLLRIFFAEVQRFHSQELGNLG